ncbi:MAG: mechanosensitive ion channel [Lentisphaeria bacterium]|nr:mechanosensitive ion channel [Lentisphaeria bacterium]
MGDFFKQVWQMIVDSNLLNIVGAVVILLVGWLLALVVSHRISKAIHAVAEKGTILPDGTDVPRVGNADTLTGKVVYYIIMIFTVLGCFSVLRLDAAAVPLQDFISTVAKYAPNIAGALLLVFAAWIVAGIVRAAAKTILLKSRINEKLAAQTGMNDPEVFVEYTAKTAYYTVFLFFLPAILNALKIYGITDPLRAMFEKVLTYIPNFIAAAAILVVGLWVAKVVRRAVSGLVVLSTRDAFGEQLGVSSTFGNKGLAAMTGVVAYVLVAIPVVISALNALKIEVLSRTVAGFFDKLLNATGDIIGAALIVFAAIWVGKFASGLVAQLTSHFGLDRFVSGMGFTVEGRETVAPSVIAGKLAFLSILVMAVLAACDILGFTRLADLIKSFSAFGGNILIGIVVLLIGIWLANFAASALRGKCSDIVASGVRAAVIVFTVALAISNMNIGDNIVEIAFSLILGAACVAAAIAFGIGGREAAGRLLNSWAEKLRK